MKPFARQAHPNGQRAKGFLALLPRFDETDKGMVSDSCNLRINEKVRIP